MKLAELERRLREQGCVLYREGGAHTIWFNPALHKIASIPRLREIKRRDGSAHLQTTGNSAAISSKRRLETQYLRAPDKSEK